MNDFDNLFSSSSSSAAAAKPAADPQRYDDFSDIFGGSARFTSKPQARGSDGVGSSSIDLDSMYGGGGGGGSKNSSLPVFDKPLYDDDIFEGVPGLKSSASAKFGDEDDVFSISSDRNKKKGEDGVGVGFDDLLGGFGKKESEFGRSKGSENVSKGKSSSDFDDLIPGFGGSSASLERSKSEATRQAEPVSITKASPNAMEDPFSVFESDKPAVDSSSGLFTDPSDEISKFSNSRSTKFDDTSASSKRMPDNMDPFDDLGKSLPTFSSEANNRGKDRGPSRTDSGRSDFQAYAEPSEKQSVKSPDSYSKRSMYVDSDLKSHQTLFDMPPVSTDSSKPVGQTFSPPSAGAASNGSHVRADISPGSEDKESTDDIWLTVSEIPLYTQPTNAPPPSRPPPPIPVKRKVNTPSSKSNTSFQSPRSATSATRSSVASIDELEEFARGKSQSAGDDYANGFSADDGEMNSVAAASAAAMKEAMDRAEAKFRHARGARERDTSWAFKSRESVQVERDENQDRLDHEQLQREREGEEREQRRQEKEREERENELRRLEKERERAREIERERARQAVERATREARERAAVEARLKAERAAAGKAAAEARERAERAAVQRAQAEARSRAAAGAKERAEKAAAEAREKERAAAEAKERERAAAEAREKAEARVRVERAAVERVAAEARARAAAEARERAAAAAKANQQRNDNDLESFFSMGRASSAPRPRPNSSDPFETQFQSKQGPGPTKTSFASSSTNIRKASSTTNVDDLSSLFGAAPSSGDFQDIEGESEERRRARLERHQRTQERAAKALAEKNERDLQVQRDQAERNRIAETLDVEIKRWAAGKEGNLRALLSTMQYVLWPECGWQPVSLTDLITGAAVKKAYRKATLCIHPDKVQQKGANLQQKYIAEKVFDLLKEAWNKFNSEELF